MISAVLCLMIIPPFLHHSYSVDGGYTHWSHWTICSTTCGSGIRGIHSCLIVNLITWTFLVGLNFFYGPFWPFPGVINLENLCFLFIAEYILLIKKKASRQFIHNLKHFNTFHTGRVRNCTNPVPSGYGKLCTAIGPHVETVICSSKPCPIDGQWDSWTPWGTCNPNCKDGNQNRNRTCIAPKNGGKECPDKEYKFEVRKCMNNILPCPVNGGYSPWVSWSDCSETCGRGISERKRICDKPEPKNGGNPCIGAQHEVKECENSPCSSRLSSSSIDMTSSISPSISSSLVYASSSIANL